MPLNQYHESSFDSVDFINRFKVLCVNPGSMMEKPNAILNETLGNKTASWSRDENAERVPVTNRMKKTRYK